MNIERDSKRAKLRSFPDETPDNLNGGPSGIVSPDGKSRNGLDLKQVSMGLNQPKSQKSKFAGEGGLNASSLKMPVEAENKAVDDATLDALATINDIRLQGLVDKDTLKYLYKLTNKKDGDEAKPQLKAKTSALDISPEENDAENQEENDNQELDNLDTIACNTKSEDFPSEFDKFTMIYSPCLRWILALTMNGDKHECTALFSAKSPASNEESGSSLYHDILSPIQMKQDDKSVRSSAVKNLKHVSFVPNTSILVGTEKTESDGPNELVAYDLETGKRFGDHRKSKNELVNGNQSNFACYLNSHRLYVLKDGKEILNKERVIVGCLFGPQVVKPCQLAGWKGRVTYYRSMDPQRLAAAGGPLSLADGYVTFKGSDESDKDQIRLEEFDQTSDVCMFVIKEGKELAVYGLLADKIKKGIVIYEIKLTLIHSKFDLKITECKIRRRVNMPEEVAYERDELRAHFNLLDPNLTSSGNLPSFTIDKELRRQKYQIVFYGNQPHIATQVPHNNYFAMSSCGKDMNIVLATKGMRGAGSVQIWMRQSYRKDIQNQHYIKVFSRLGENVSSCVLSPDFKYLWCIEAKISSEDSQQGASHRISRYQINLCSMPVVVANCHLAPGDQTQSEAMADKTTAIGDTTKTLALDQVLITAHRDRIVVVDNRARIMNDKVMRFGYGVTEADITIEAPLPVIVRGEHMELLCVSASTGYERIHLLYMNTNKSENSYLVTYRYELVETSSPFDINKSLFNRKLEISDATLTTLENTADIANCRLIGDFLLNISEKLKPLLVTKTKSAIPINQKRIEFNVGVMHLPDKTPFDNIETTDTPHFGCVDDRLVIYWNTPENLNNEFVDGDPQVKSDNNIGGLQVKIIWHEGYFKDASITLAAENYKLANDFYSSFPNSKQAKDHYHQFPMVFWNKGRGIQLVKIKCSDTGNKIRSEIEHQCWSYDGPILAQPVLTGFCSNECKCFRNTAGKLFREKGCRAIYFITANRQINSMWLGDTEIKEKKARDSKKQLFSYMYNPPEPDEREINASILEKEPEEVLRRESYDVFFIATGDKVYENRDISMREKMEKKLKKEEDDDKVREPFEVRLDRDKQYEVERRAKLAVVTQEKHNDTELTVSVWCLHDRRWLYEFTVETPSRFALRPPPIKDVGKVDYHMSKHFTFSNEAFHIQYFLNAKVNNARYRTDLSIDYEFSNESDNYSTKILPTLMNEHSKMKSEEQKVEVLNKIRAYLRLNDPHMIQNVGTMFSIFYNMNESEIFEVFLEKTNLQKVFYQCRFYEIFFIDSDKNEVRECILDAIKQAFEDNNENYMINPKAANAFMSQNNGELMRNEYSRDFFKFMLQCPISAKHTGQLQDLKARAFDIDNNYFRASGHIGGFRLFWRRLFMTKRKKINEEELLQDMNVAQEFSDLKAHIPRNEDVDFTTYDAYRSLARISMASGSEDSTNLFLTIMRLSEDDIENQLAPLIYYKWKSLMMLGYLYSLFYWLMTSIAYAYFGFYTKNTVFAILLIVLTSLFFLYELKTSWALGPTEYFNDKWNYPDLLLLGFTIGSTVTLLLQEDHENIPMVSIRVIAVTLLWVRAITWLRVISPIRYLITMVVEVFWDMRAFMVVFITAILGYTFVWRLSPLLSINEDGIILDTPGFYDTLYVSVMLIFGSSPEGEDNGDPFGYVRFAINALGNIILSFAFLNFLIAVISGTYERVNERKDLYDCKELLKMIVEFNAVMHGLTRKSDPAFFFTLHPMVKPDESKQQLKDKIEKLNTKVEKRSNDLHDKISALITDNMLKLDEEIKASFKQLNTELTDAFVTSKDK